MNRNKSTVSRELTRHANKKDYLHKQADKVLQIPTPLTQEIPQTLWQKQSRQDT